MKKRLVLVLTAVAASAALLLAGATFAFGGGSGLIWDDNHFAKPGTLDDGKELQPQATINLARANAAAQQAAAGALGQVDLESDNGRLVYVVDIGDHEVRVDADDGSIVSVEPRS